MSNQDDPDDDNDGMPDTWEQQFGLDPLSAADAALDPDEDGRDNLTEFIDGTDPSLADAAEIKQVPTLPPAGLLLLAGLLALAARRAGRLREG